MANWTLNQSQETYLSAAQLRPIILSTLRSRLEVESRRSAVISESYNQTTFDPSEFDLRKSGKFRPQPNFIVNSLNESEEDNENNGKENITCKDYSDEKVSEKSTISPSQTRAEVCQVTLFCDNYRNHVRTDGNQREP